MEEALRRHVVGQEEVVDAISRALLRLRFGIRDTRRPIASFFFTGPTGRWLCCVPRPPGTKREFVLVSFIMQ